VGKTTFLVELVAELAKRGYRVGVIKHSVHAFDPGHPGKDTWKHARAGAKAVAFASQEQCVVNRQLDREMEIDEIALLMGEVDLILTEGYKSAHKPKIEIARLEHGIDLVSPLDELIALVSDEPLDVDVPEFGLEDASGVAALLESQFLR
jgi:molybdopterin-guanine dinucleotide biosynthesis protein B